MARRRGRPRTITIDLDDYLDDIDPAIDEDGAESIRDLIWRAMRELYGPNPNVQQALLYAERALTELNAACPERRPSPKLDDAMRKMRP